MINGFLILKYYSAVLPTQAIQQEVQLNENQSPGPFFTLVKEARSKWTLTVLVHFHLNAFRFRIH